MEFHDIRNVIPALLPHRSYHFQSETDRLEGRVACHGNVKDVGKSESYFREGHLKIEI
jgi:hypothetical protein